MCLDSSGCKYAFDSDPWDYVSDAAKDLLRRIFVLDPDARPTAQEVSGVEPYLVYIPTHTFRIWRI